jgi:hypothetical protein
MNDIKKSIWNKRLPSVLGVLFLALSIGTIGWLSGNAVLFGTKAATDATPKNVKISNVSDSSFSVSFITTDSAPSGIKYGTSNNPDFVALDDRDIEKGKLSNYTAHHITVKNLSPSTKHYFVITSGGNNFLNGTSPYEVTTGADPVVKKIGNIMNGKVINEDGQAPDEGLVYASIDPSKVASGLVSNGGSYVIDLSVLGEVKPDSVLNLVILASNKESKVTLNGSQISRVPLVTLSKNYDFLFGTDPLPELEVATGSADTPAVFPTSSISSEDGPQILTPEEDQNLSDQQPLFTGTAAPNAEVEITIESDPITTTVMATGNGNWQFRPDTELEPGTHTVTIRTTDAQGILRTIRQSFTVYAEGSQFTEPSVSPVQATATPTIVSATTAPTIASSPTPTTVQVTEVQNTTPTITTQVPIPVTGNTTLLIIMITFVSAVAIGTLLFIFTAV